MADETAEQRRARIRALHPEDRAVLAGIIRKQLDRIPDQIAKLRKDEQALTEWLAEFAPGALPAPASSTAHVADALPTCAKG